MWEEAASKFLFQIGDRVLHKSQPAVDTYPEPVPGVVIERALIECQGGIQRTYFVRSHGFQRNSGRGSTMGTEYCEVELAPYTLPAEPPAEPVK